MGCHSDIYTMYLPTKLLPARKLLGIDANGQEILESDDDFRQRIRAIYEFNE